MTMSDEALFYNAILIALAGDRSRAARLKGPTGTWREAYGRLPARSSVPDPAREGQKLRDAGVDLVLFEETPFPSLLREMQDPPSGIYIRGRASFHDIEYIAIVGTRRGTPDGISTSKRFARELARSGFGIVSGLALGIDAAAHEGCLDAGGTTIAVLAGGLDGTYPATNEHLALRVLKQGGAVISEYPLGAPPLPYRFLERNRIVSGLSKGVLVVEAPERSGSLATARFALEQNRDVFVIPGPITNQNFAGSHALIRQGAELVTRPEDILEGYGIASEDGTLKEDISASPEERTVFEVLRNSSLPLDVDKIIEMAKLEPRIAHQAITFLSIKGYIKETERGYTIETSH